MYGKSNPLQKRISVETAEFVSSNNVIETKSGLPARIVGVAELPQHWTVSYLRFFARNFSCGEADGPINTTHYDASHELLSVEVAFSPWLDTSSYWRDWLRCYPTHFALPLPDAPPLLYFNTPSQSMLAAPTQKRNPSRPLDTLFFTSIRSFFSFFFRLRYLKLFRNPLRTFYERTYSLSSRWAQYYIYTVSSRWESLV